jgi:hypothetical protein
MVVNMRGFIFIRIFPIFKRIEDKRKGNPIPRIVYWIVPYQINWYGKYYLKFKTGKSYNQNC